MADISLKMATDFEILDELALRLGAYSPPGNIDDTDPSAVGDLPKEGGVLAAKYDTSPVNESAEDIIRDKPAGMRVVRTKQSGDRVYLLDDEKKTRQWMTNPKVVESYGFDMADIVEVDDDELLRYQQGQAIFEPRT